MKFNEVQADLVDQIASLSAEWFAIERLKDLDHCDDSSKYGFLKVCSGKYQSVLNFQPEDFNINDTLHSLSFINRYLGHKKQGFSVLAHSILAAWNAEIREDIPQADIPAFCLLCLRHDFAESIIGDIISPIKNIPILKPIIDQIEKPILDAIDVSLGLTEYALKYEQQVKEVDKQCYFQEINYFDKCQTNDQLSLLLSEDREFLVSVGKNLFSNLRKEIR